MHMCGSQTQHGLHSHDILQMLGWGGEVAFKYAAPCSWNNAQKDLKLSELITAGEFKETLNDLQNSRLN